MALETDWALRAHKISVSALALVATLLVADVADAQLQTGNLLGTVMDERGEVLPGVIITLTGAGPSQTQVTNIKGQFRFPNLGPGNYALKAQLEGFSTVEFPNVIINVGRNTSIEVTMNAATEDIIGVRPRR